MLLQADDDAAVIVTDVGMHDIEARGDDSRARGGVEMESVETDDARWMDGWMGAHAAAAAANDANVS